MLLVIDANPFIAGFLRNSASRRIILSDGVELFSPEWLLKEFEKNEFELREKFPASENFWETKKILFAFIKLVPAAEYSEHMKEASKLSKNAKDDPYFALALSLNCAIWSDESSFKRQQSVKVFSTSDLVKELDKP